MSTFADKILSFNKNLKLTTALPAGVEVMNPYKDPDAFELCAKFYYKYYSDLNHRTLILGINPGRFGGGITGVPFTDPIKLEQICGIPNHLKKKTELSADFIYQMINAYGGPEKFYGRFFISAISPLGFVKEGKNMNYYDLPELQKRLLDFIVTSIKTQLDFGVSRKACYCLGEGQNFKFLCKLNDEFKFFEQITPLPHPRFIMQYRRKRIDEFIQVYLVKLDKHDH